MLKLIQRKNSPNWFIRGTHYGVEVYRSAGTASKTEAQHVLKNIETQIFAKVHGFTEEKQHYIFADALGNWLDTAPKLESFPYLELILKELGETPLSDFTTAFIDRAAVRLFPTQSANTRRRHFYTPVSLILNHAVDEGWINPVRIKRPKPSKEKPTRILTPPQVEQLMAADPPFADCIAFMVGTGARNKEVFSLGYSDGVSAFGGRVIFWDTKSGKARSLDLCDKTAAAMPVQGGSGFDAVWLNPETGKPWSQNPKTGRVYGPTQRLARLSVRMGWPKIGTHTLRHSYASWHYAINTDVLGLMRDGGWSDQKMIERYVHLGSPDLAQQVKDHGWFEYQNRAKSVQNLA